jgi:hypothetical protein
MTLFRPSILRSALFAIALIALATSEEASAQPAGVNGPPTPLLDAIHPVDWVFAYKFNASSFPTKGELKKCLFGGKPRTDAVSLKYAVASSSFGALLNGPGLIGTGLDDPVGATFNEIYNGNLFFVVWNDQFNGHPRVTGCGDDCDAPWGHLKGILAWDSAGNGIMLQVSTPAWPGSGTAQVRRTGDGNTLGCTIKNNVKFAQHFFALKLTPADTAVVLDALVNASAPADIHNPQIARIGGPPEIVARASLLGQKSQSDKVTDTVLSTGVRLISKPSKLQVPPWQLVSAELGSVPLRTATWAGSPFIRTTKDNSPIGCWRPELGTPKRVEVALTGRWAGKLIGVSASNSHAKLGISLDATKPYTILGDLNQQGALSGKCVSAQNGRGGLFFVLQDVQLYASMRQLLPDDVALKPMAKKKSARRHSRQTRRPR